MRIRDCVPAWAGILGVLLPAGGWLRAQGVEVKEPQQAIILLQSGQRYVGQLQTLNAKEVRILFQAGRPPTVYPAASVRAVQTTNDLYVFNATKKEFESLRQQQAAARQERVDLESRRSGAVTLTNGTDTVVTVRITAFADEEGRDVAAAEPIVASLKPKETFEVTQAGKRLVTSRLTMTVQNRHGWTARAVQHTETGRPFVVLVGESDLCAPLLVACSDWLLESQSSYSTKQVQAPQRLVQERGGLLGMGPPTGNFRVEGGEVHERSVEDRSRYASASAWVENPTDFPLEVTVTLRFHAKRELVVSVAFGDKDETKTVVVGPRSKTQVTVSADMAAKITGALGGLYRASGASGGEDPVYWQYAERVTLLRITTRPK